MNNKFLELKYLINLAIQNVIYMKNSTCNGLLVIIFTLVAFCSTISYGQNCRSILSNSYDADTDIEYSDLIGGIIQDDGAKVLFTGFQDILALYVGKTVDGQILLYFQQTRYVDKNNLTDREDLSIDSGEVLTIIVESGKLDLVAIKDQKPSKEVKAFTGQTKYKICQVYNLTRDQMNKLCSSKIKQMIINYSNSPKLIKKISDKNAKKHLKFWSCVPQKF